MIETEKSNGFGRKHLRTCCHYFFLTVYLNQDLRNHKCPHCDKAFHNKQRLERHINSQHTKSRLWPCPVCSSKYDRKDNLRTHIRKNHSGILNPDTVELHAVENEADGGGLDSLLPAAPRGKAVSRAGSTGQSTGTLISVSPECSPPQVHHHHHVAQDLLSLKYGDDQQIHHYKLTTADLQQLAGAKREDQQLRIPFTGAESASALSMRQDQDYGSAAGGGVVVNRTTVQRAEEEYFRMAAAMASAKHDRSPPGEGGVAGVNLSGRLSVHQPSPSVTLHHHHSAGAGRELVTVVGSGVAARDMMQAVRESVAAGGHPSLAHTIHQIQNGYAFPGLPGHPI